jgi:hypothetical protein
MLTLGCSLMTVRSPYLNHTFCYQIEIIVNSSKSSQRLPKTSFVCALGSEGLAGLGDPYIIKVGSQTGSTAGGIR